MIIRKKYLFMGLFLLCLAGLYLKGSAEEARGKVEVKWLYPLKYYKGNEFIDGRAWVQEEENGPWSLLDDQGNVLKTGFEAFQVSRYVGDVAAFILPSSDGGEQSWDLGCLDRSGDVIMSPSAIDNADGIYNEGLICKKGKNGLRGFIDLSGKWVIPPAYDGCYHFQEGLAAVKKRGKYGFIDKKGDVVIDFKFDEVKSFFHKMAPVREDSKWGVIDTNGRWIAKPIYEEFYGSHWSDPIRLVKDGKVGFVDSKGNVVIDFQYPNHDPFVRLDGKEIFTDLYYFSNGRAIVILDDSDRENLEFGLIDESGKVLFRRKGCVLTIQGGYILCCLNENKQLSLIDRDGREYALPDNFKYPSTWGVQNDSDVFMFYDRKTDKRGYFKMSVNRD